jgi:hypothetical protein
MKFTTLNNILAVANHFNNPKDHLVDSRVSTIVYALKHSKRSPGRDRSSRNM